MKVVRNIYYALSPQLRMVARKLFFLPADIWNSATGKRHPYEPPKGDIYIGSGNFIEQGQHHLDLLKKHIQMSPNDSVLDIGSGIGRTAVALTTFLNSEGKYEGFDVVKKGVDWCNSKIKRDFPNFNFRYVPLNNDLYNSIETQAVDFQFPYSEETFDKSYLFSVFTHMQATEVAHYLKELGRVLKPGGKCLATFFIYNSKTEAAIASSDHPFAFPFLKDGFRQMNEKVKSANIAFSLTLLESMVEEAGLRIEKIELGYWSGFAEKAKENDFQDLVILTK